MIRKSYRYFFILFILLHAAIFPEQQSPKIAVVGAGLAGLTAAHSLQKNGFDVTVYEARNRVGGRVFTVNLQGHLGELGGQNIYDGGSADNILSLIDQLGLETEGRKSLMNLNYCNNEELF